MNCNNFKCIYPDDDNVCETAGGECIDDMCECFGECSSCQNQDDEEIECIN